MASSWGSSWGTSWLNSWGDGGVIPPTPEPPHGSAGGGRYTRHWTPIPYEDCRKEVKKVTAKKKKLEKRITALEIEIESKESRAKYEFNMRVLNALMAELVELKKHLDELQKKLDQIEEEEMMVIAMVCSHFT